MYNLMWFRRDLRLADNPALYYAAQSGPVLPIYIFDENSPPGEASRWWLHESLDALSKSINKHQGNLYLLKGKAEQVLIELCQKYQINNIYYNKLFGDEGYIDLELFTQHNIKIHQFNGSLLHEPLLVTNENGGQYKVFTPFWRKLQTLNFRNNFPIPKCDFTKLDLNQAIDSLGILPANKWHQKFGNFWQVGEDAALKKLDKFIEDKIHVYKESRDFPAQDGTTLLSPHLAWGEISPVTIFSKVNEELVKDDSTRVFLSELGWREFSYYLLYNFPQLPSICWNVKFKDFPWEDNQELFQAWTRGETGYPLIDAGMKQLWQTGWMHNRVRMITASFLVKNLLIPWQKGAAWFMDCLVDADIANNSASWQWVAGCGADASPFFRIFNPELQKEKFDPSGDYIKRWLPEYPQNYSARIVNYEASRNRVLSVLKRMKD